MAGGKSYQKVLEILIKVVDESKSAVSSLKSNLQSVQQTASSANNAFSSLGKATQSAVSSASQLGSSYSNAANALNQTKAASAGLSQSQSALASAFGKVSGVVSSLGSSFQSYVRQLQQAQSATVSLSEVVGELVGIGSKLGAFAFPVMQAAEFERKLSEAQAVMQASTEEMGAFEEEAKQLGRTTEYTASQAAEGFLMLGRAGIKGEEALKALPVALNLAQAGAMDLGTATDIVTNIMTSFNLEASKLPSVSDKLTAAFTNSNSTLSELGEAFKYVGSIAASMGGDFSDVVTALGALHNAGIKASMAGTALRGTLSALLNPTRDEAALMAELSDRIGGAGLQITDAQGNFVGFVNIVKQLEQAGITGGEAMRLFGDRAGPGMAALVNIGSKALEDFLSKVEKSDGVTQRVAEDMNKNLVGAWKNFMSALEGLSITVGDQIKPTIEAVLRSLEDLINGVTDFAKANPELTKSLVSLAAAFAAVSAAASALKLVSLVASVTQLITVFSAAATAAQTLAATFGVLGGAFAALTVLWSAKQVSDLVVAMKEAADASDELGKTADVYRKNAEAFSQYKDVVVRGSQEIRTMQEQELRSYYTSLMGAIQYYKNMITSLTVQSEQRGFLSLFPTEEAIQAQQQLPQVKARYDELMTALSNVGVRARELGIDLSALDTAQRTAAQGASQAVLGFVQMGSILENVKARYSSLLETVGDFFKKQANMASVGAKTAIDALQLQVEAYRQQYQTIGQILQEQLNQEQQIIQQSTATEKQRADAIRQIANEIKQARIEAIEEWKNKLQSALQSALELEKQYAEKIKALRQEYVNVQRSTEDQVREIRRQAMTEEEQWRDRQAQAAEKLRLAQEELAKGTPEGMQAAKQLAQEAQGLYRSLASEVKQGETVVVSLQQGIEAATTGIQQSGVILQQVINQEIANTEQQLQQTRSFIDELKAAIEEAQNAMSQLSSVEITPSMNLEELNAQIESIKTQLASVPEALSQMPLKLDLSPIQQEVDRISSYVNNIMEQFNKPVTLKVNVDDSEAKEALNELQKTTHSTHIIHVKVEREGGGEEGESEGGYISGYATGGKVLASGGKLSGYGGGDRIRALLEAGEYVIRKEAVRKYGKALFDLLNGMRVPVHSVLSAFRVPEGVRRFATGGLVDSGMTFTLRLQTAGAEIPIRAVGDPWATRKAIQQMERELYRVRLTRS